MMRIINLLIVSLFSICAWAQPTLDGSTVTGAIGEVITIGGTNFTNNGVVVQFQNAAGGPMDAPATFVSPSQISVMVPSKAGNGNVSVLFNNVAAAGTLTFVAKAAVLTGFYPQIITVGSPFLLQGKYFDMLDQSPNAYTITVAGVPAVLTNYRPKGGQTVEEGAELTITVPDPGVAHPLPLVGEIKVALRNGTEQMIGIMKIVANPVISSNTTPPSVTSGADFGIVANFTLLGIDLPQLKAHVKYRSLTKGPSEPFTVTSLTVSQLPGPAFDKFIVTGSISKDDIGALGVEYQLQVYPDETFNVMNLDSTQSIFAKVIHVDGIPLGYTSGASQKAYRIIATPLVMTDKLVNQNFGTYTNTVYRMFRLQPGGTTYTELTGTDALEPGIGYWFIYNGPDHPKLNPGTTVDATNTSPFQIELIPGWNMIGNPYNFSISWSEVLAANPTVSGISTAVRVYRGESHDQDLLGALEGGFVSNTTTSPVLLKIPVKRSSAGGRIASQPNLRNAIDNPEFEVMFKLSVADKSYSLGGFGMNPAASEGPDKFDDYNIPHFLEYLEIKHAKTAVNMTVTKDIVPSTANHTWEFEVASNLDDKNTTLSWDNSYFGNAKEIVLLDVSTFRAINMVQESNYRFHRGVSGKFKVIYGSHEYVQAQLTPDRLTISDPYPNPFNGKIKIDFAMPPSRGDGMVEVLDVTGNRISSLPAIAESGIYHWEWDSEGKAPGMYFVKVSVGNERVIRKIIKQ